MKQKYSHKSLWAMLLLLAVVLTGCGRPQRKPEVPKGKYFTIITYNVNYGMGNPLESINAMRSANADILCLQETSKKWEEILKPHLKTTYPHYLFKHSSGAGGLAVFSKFPIRDKKYMKPKYGWFPAWIVEADTPLGPVQLLNVHLRPALSNKGSVNVSSYFGTKKVRRAEIIHFTSFLDENKKAIILGDFNDKDSGKALVWLKQQGYTDALPRFDKKTPTWRWRTRFMTLKSRLDHIVYTKDLYCTNAKVILRGSSDHFPVYAVMTDPKTQIPPEK